MVYSDKITRNCHVVKSICVKNLSNGKRKKEENLYNSEDFLAEKGDTVICRDNSMINSMKAATKESLDDYKDFFDNKYKYIRELNEFFYTIRRNYEKYGIDVVQRVPKITCFINEHGIMRNVSISKYEKFNGEKICKLEYIFCDKHFSGIGGFLHYFEQKEKGLKKGNLGAVMSCSNFFITQGIHYSELSESVFVPANTYALLPGNTEAEKIKALEASGQICHKEYRLNINRKRSGVICICALYIDFDMPHGKNKEEKKKMQKQLSMDIEMALDRFGISAAAKIKTNNGYQIVIALDKMYYIDEGDYKYASMKGENCGHLSYEKVNNLNTLVQLMFSEYVSVDKNAADSICRINRFGGIHIKSDNIESPFTVFEYVRDIKQEKNVYTPEELLMKCEAIAQERHDNDMLDAIKLYHSNSFNSQKALDSYVKSKMKEESVKKCNNTEADQLNEIFKEKDYKKLEKFLNKILRKNHIEKKDFIDELVDLSCSNLSEAEQIFNQRYINDEEMLSYLPINKEENPYDAGEVSESSESTDGPGGSPTTITHNRTFDEYERAFLKRVGRRVSITQRNIMLSKYAYADRTVRVVYHGEISGELKQYVLHLLSIVAKLDKLGIKQRHVYKLVKEAILKFCDTLVLNHHSFYQKIVNEGYFIMNTKLFDLVLEEFFEEEEKLGTQLMQFFEYIGLFKTYTLDIERHKLPKYSETPIGIKHYNVIEFKYPDVQDVIDKITELGRHRHFDKDENIFVQRINLTKLRMQYKDSLYKCEFKPQDVPEGDTKIIAPREVVIANDYSHLYNDEQPFKTSEMVMGKVLGACVTHLVEKEVSKKNYDEKDASYQEKQYIKGKLEEIKKTSEVLFDNIFDEWDNVMARGLRNANESYLKHIKSYFHKDSLKSHIYDAMVFNVIDVRMARCDDLILTPKCDYLLHGNYNNYNSYVLKYCYDKKCDNMISDFIQKTLLGNVDTSLMIKIYDELESFYDICSKECTDNVVLFSSYMSQKIKQSKAA